ncbi:MAG: hypothetical protein CL933_25000 [Deltaproteobacteria bacterium]|nr:hypothetical protein [Deltaproteobacteria bacterium]
MRLRDRIVVVTGGGQGMGMAYARRFLEEGAGVVIAEIDAERGANAVAELRGLGDVSLAQVDISDEGSTRECAARIVEERGRKLTDADGRNELIEASERLTPMGIAAFQPEDMTGTAVYFASDDARYVTGQLIVIDGGMVSPT